MRPVESPRVLVTEASGDSAYSRGDTASNREVHFIPHHASSVQLSTFSLNRYAQYLQEHSEIRCVRDEAASALGAQDDVIIPEWYGRQAHEPGHDYSSLHDLRESLSRQ